VCLRMRPEPNFPVARKSLDSLDVRQQLAVIDEDLGSWKIRYEHRVIG